MTHRTECLEHSWKTRTEDGRSLVPILGMVALLAWSQPAGAQSVDTIVTWNRVMLTAVATPGAQPPTVFFTRSTALVSAAVFDAANSFDRVCRPYATWVDVPAGASRDAAVAQASHDALVGVIPSLTAVYDAALAASLAGIPAQAAADGSKVGAAAAKAILELRTGDGWERPFPPLVLPNLPGYWKSTPPNNPTAGFTNYPDARGFIVENGRRFLPEGPPALTSARYATDFNQVKSWGAVNCTVRSAEQTLISQHWAGVGTTTPVQNVWNNLLGDLAGSKGWSGLDLARGYALLNMTLHDALLTSFTGKYIYGLWRPVTAVREADTDGNDATQADPTWLLLLTTCPIRARPATWPASPERRRA